MRRWPLALSLLLVLFGMLMAAPPATGQAGETATLRGRLVNGTVGGGVPADAEVVLHAFRGDAHAEDRPARSAADGSFVFEGIETLGGYVYQVTAAYAGSTYSSEALGFGPGERERRVELTVYESTDANPGLLVRRVTVIVAGVDAASQTVQAIEMVVLENPVDRTYLPSPTGPAGPMGLLRFPLPPGAADLQPGPGLESAEIFQVDRGFATTAPIPPGATEFLFGYRFPYRSGRVPIARAVPYPTGELQLLVPGDAPSVESPDLRPADALQLGERTYRRYVARDLPAGRPIELVLGDLPGRWPFNLPLDDVPAPLWGGLGALVALALVTGYAWRARRLATDEPATPVADRQALLEELARLDAAFVAGQLAEETYRARREATKACLVELLRAPPASLPELASGEHRPRGRTEGTATDEEATHQSGVGTRGA